MPSRPAALPRFHRLIGVSVLAFLASCNPTTDAADATATPSPPLLWPVAGVDAKDWIINNYVDLDSTSGMRDYRNNVGSAAKTYDGHNGVDIDVPDFRWMDGNLALARSAAAGTVTAIGDGQFDRNVACAGTHNYVSVRQADGRTASYMHLKNGSLTVSVGQQVAAGATLGTIGSSGCSTQPHLHFELRDAANRVVDPFARGFWASPPVYDTPVGLMDVALRVGGFSTVDQLKDPGADATTIVHGGTIGVGVSVGGGHTGDVVSVVLAAPGGATYSTDAVTFTQTYRHTFWYWNRILSAATGTWTATVSVNGVVARTLTFTAN
jgi:murein DD-endopeptidase MepM/ murein hydrolase activator NlpD